MDSDTELLAQALQGKKLSSEDAYRLAENAQENTEARLSLEKAALNVKRAVYTVIGLVSANFINDFFG